MEIDEDERYSGGSYPKLKQLFDAKTKLINQKNHPSMRVVVNDLQRTNFMLFEKQFDVIVLKLPIDDPKWSLDHF